MASLVRWSGQGDRDPEELSDRGVSVRRPLTDHVCVRTELEGVHEQVRTFRNATIAHSQSELSVTYPIGVLEPAFLELSHVSGVPMTGTLPPHVVHQFRMMLIDAVVDELDAVI